VGTRLAFFREYIGLSEADKERYRKMLDLIKPTPQE